MRLRDGGYQPVVSGKPDLSATKMPPGTGAARPLTIGPIDASASIGRTLVLRAALVEAAVQRAVLRRLLARYRADAGEPEPGSEAAALLAEVEEVLR